MRLVQNTGNDRVIDFPHKRAVEWLMLEPWQMPVLEGPRTTVYELGRNAANLLELEQRLCRREADSIRATTFTFAVCEPYAGEG